MVKSTKDALIIGRKLLAENSIDMSEARLLLASAMGKTRDELSRVDFCGEEEYTKFMKYIERRIDGEPYAYIVGYKEFMKLKFIVNKDVLIPREDTEVLVLEAIKECKEKILDLCTGSGCVAISLAKYINNSKVDAADICQKALNVAKENAILNNVQVNFIKSDLFKNVTEKYDIIVSNPPYIKTCDMENLQKEVKREPKKALDGGEDGIYFYRKIVEEAKNYLNDDGTLILEIGYDEAKSVMQILKDNNYRKIRKIKDLSGNDRVVYAKKG